MAKHGALTAFARIALLAATASCGREERNVIRETAPFFSVSLPYDAAKSDKIIASVQEYSKARRLDFLLSRDEPQIGDYNVSANGQHLNFQVMHLSAVSNTTDVSVVAQGKPTLTDIQAAKAFLCIVRLECDPGTGRELR